MRFILLEASHVFSYIVSRVLQKVEMKAFSFKLSTSNRILVETVFLYFLKH